MSQIQRPDLSYPPYVFDVSVFQERIADEESQAFPVRSSDAERPSPKQNNFARAFSHLHVSSDRILASRDDHIDKEAFDEICNGSAQKLPFWFDQGS
jgi:hypothetical protein